MMIRINLLPHREATRKRQQRQFIGLLSVGAIVGLFACLLVHLFISEQIAHQVSRNDFLKKENARLDKEIEEIKKLKEEIAALLARKQVIETLQGDRAQSVQLLDELAKQTPDGVYLRTVKQEGLKVNLTGYAQSQARVSALMRNIQGSPHIGEPFLVEIKAANVSNRRLAEFALHFKVKRALPQEPPADGGKPNPNRAASSGAAKGRSSEQG